MSIADPPTPPTWNEPDGGGPRRLAGRYRLDRAIGSGAMGTVWTAYDEVLRRWVAIKEVNFPPGMPAAEVELVADRTLREARAIAALSNPHVITLYDILTPPSGPVIVMELMSARSLAMLLSEQGPLRDGQAATVGVSVAAGLLAAHSAGITHRDVKPGNVLIGYDGRIKLTDFGIARSASEHTMTATGMLLGSPAYISPEVAAGQPATPAADAWGLGALLFACVQGYPPFDKGEPIATLTSVVADPVPPHPASGRLGPVIDALLIKDPAHRMTVGFAAGMLTQVADDPTGGHLSVSARPAPPNPTRRAPQSFSAPGDHGAAAAAPLPRPGPLGSPAPGSPLSVSSAPPLSSLGLPAPLPEPLGSPAPGSSAPRRPPPGLPSLGLPALGSSAPPLSSLGPPAPGSPALGSSPAPARSPALGPLPPPPWAVDAGAGLASLPAVAPPRRWGWLIVAALLVALAAAAAGYFGVRAIAGLA